MAKPPNLLIISPSAWEAMLRATGEVHSGNREEAEGIIYNLLYALWTGQIPGFTLENRSP